MIKILIVDDQKTVRESLRSWLEPVINFKIVGTASDGYSAIEQVEILKPDVVLIDMEMPVLDGVETTAAICQKFIGVKVIVLSMHDGQEYVSRSLQAGATGYLLKNTPKQELIDAIAFVNRGYSQFAPGLVNKIVGTIPPSQATETKGIATHLDSSQFTPLDRSKTNTRSSLSKPRSKKIYLTIWLLGNLLIWVGSLAYLQFKKPTYQSEWAIALPASNSSTSIDIPGVGQASSQSESPYNSDFSDPRENYKYLATTEEVIENAADKLGMKKSKFGKPQINTPGNTTLIEFQIEGEEPEIAQAKAIALQESLSSSLKRLRQDESSDRSQDLEETLAVADKKLEAARERLSQFQLSSGLGSTDQTSNLTSNIEDLRKQKVETVAQERETSSRFNQLQNSLGITTEAAANALRLQSDQEFKEYLSSYSEISRELANLNANFSANHPSVISKQAQQEEVRSALYRRGEAILGQPLSENDLTNINSDGGGSISQRADLFQELVSLQAEQQGLIEREQSLVRQISQLETKLGKLTQDASKLQQLQKNVQLAQAVYSSTATKLELSKSKTSASYPPISVVSSPSFPEDAASPKTELVLLGSVMSSLLLTTGLYSLWLKDQRDRQEELLLSNSEKFHQNGKGDYQIPLPPEKVKSVDSQD